MGDTERITADGNSTRIEMVVSDTNGEFFAGCPSNADCPPNVTMQDGLAGTDSAPSGGGLSPSLLVIRASGGRVVDLMAFPENRKDAPPLPYDFDELITSKGFADMVTADIEDLSVATHPA